MYLYRKEKKWGIGGHGSGFVGRVHGLDLKVGSEFEFKVRTQIRPINYLFNGSSKIRSIHLKKKRVPSGSNRVLDPLTIPSHKKSLQKCL